jgi:membrane protease YdiL (CAAX protease family)
LLLQLKFMNKLSPYLIFTLYLTLLIFFETSAQDFLAFTDLAKYRSEKLSQLLFTLFIFSLFFCFRVPVNENIIFSPPSFYPALHCIVFGIFLGIGTIALVSIQVYLVALVLPNLNEYWWTFTGTEATIGATNYFLGLESGYINLTLFILAQIICMPIVEEFYFRGLILQKFLSRRSTMYSILVTSILFSLPHPKYQLIYTLVFSIMVCYYFLAFRNIWLVAIIHVLNNFMSWVYVGFGGISFLESRSSEDIAQVSTWYIELFMAIFFIAACLYMLRSAYRKNCFNNLSDAPDLQF